MRRPHSRWAAGGRGDDAGNGISLASTRRNMVLDGRGRVWCELVEGTQLEQMAACDWASPCGDPASAILRASTLHPPFSRRRCSRTQARTDRPQRLLCFVLTPSRVVLACPARLLSSPPPARLSSQPRVVATHSSLGDHGPDEGQCQWADLPMHRLRQDFLAQRGEAALCPLSSRRLSNGPADSHAFAPPRACATSQYMARHYRSKHSKEKPFQCEYCDHAFSRRSVPRLIRSSSSPLTVIAT